MVYMDILTSLLDTTLISSLNLSNLFYFFPFSKFFHFFGPRCGFILFNFSFSSFTLFFDYFVLFAFLFYSFLFLNLRCTRINFYFHYTLVITNHLCIPIIPTVNLDNLLELKYTVSKEVPGTMQAHCNNQDE